MESYQKYQILSLKQKPELLTEVIDLAQTSLNYEKNYQFKTDFAPLLSLKNLENCWIIIDKTSQKLIAHIGVSPRFLNIRGHKFKICLLGGIFVRETYRKQGIFKILMNEVLNNYSNKCTLFFLWSDNHPLYQKFSFYPSFGQVESVPNKLLDKFILENNIIKTKYHLLNNEEKKQIQKIYKSTSEKLYFGIIRDSDDWKSIENISSSDLYIKKDDIGKIIFYFFMNKGQDLRGIVHELGFVSGQAALAFSLTQYCKTWLPEKLQQKMEIHQLQFMALVRLGSRSMFSKMIEIWSKNKINILTVSESEIEFIISKQRFQMSFHQFLTEVFGPIPQESYFNIGPAIFINGLDSI